MLFDLPPHRIESYVHELKLKSYVLLCHSAIEEYLERVSMAVLSESFELFKKDRKIRDPLLCVCSYYKIGLPKEVASRKSGDSFSEIFEKLCERALGEHAVAIDSIHGIKTKDQDAILLPVGLRIFDLDRVLSQNLNAFGGTRGRLAHQFGIKSLTPKIGQEAAVWSLVSLLRGLDNTLCERFRMVYEYS